jgi:AcrR family transcriptional regulator
MKIKQRMSHDERQSCILAAVRNVFAQKGLEGATTRELAKTADVSEALLYKHFPSKEDLYGAMLKECAGDFAGELQKIAALKPSTPTLILTVHFLVSKLLLNRKPEIDVLVRLYLRSIAKDGEFARIAVKQMAPALVAKLQECIKASIKAGDVVNNPIPHTLRAWFVDRLALSVMIDLLPQIPVIHYGVDRQELVKHIVWFVLRGIGLKEEVIRRHYNLKTLSFLNN